MSNHDHEQPILDSAITFIRAGLPNHLPGRESCLIDNCIEHLTEQHGISARNAERMSHQALAELQGRKMAKVVIDTEASNSHVVFLKDGQDGLTYSFSAALLRDLAFSHGTPLIHS